jgi:hypothetical protein
VAVVASARTLTVGAVALLFAGLVPLLAPRDEPGETLSGHDVSWPQCPKALGGYDLPMPPADSQFVIIGLTKGLPFTENPCLADQVGWTRVNRKPAHAYTVAAFPTADQLETHKAAGPLPGTGRADQLNNVGYAQAQFALRSLAGVEFAPPMVWIDVEPRPAQPWPTATLTQQLENRMVIEGLLRGLGDAGVSYGIYSYANAWRSITGSWQLPGVPVWATAGRLDHPTEAHDRCTQPSFSGGPVLLSQWYDDTRDYDMTCAPFGREPMTFGPLPASP